MIRTKRLLMRPMEEEDRAWFVAQAASPVIMARLGGPQDPAFASTRFDHLRGCQATHGFSFWLMVLRDGGERVGICGLKLFDAPAAPALAGALEMGWRLEPPFWGQGYAREAASATLDHAFGPARGERVYAITNARNTASWGLMERLGMNRRRELDFLDPRYPPDDNPTIVYDIRAAQWPKSA